MTVRRQISINSPCYSRSRLSAPLGTFFFSFDPLPALSHFFDQGSFPQDFFLSFCSPPFSPAEGDDFRQRARARCRSRTVLFSAEPPPEPSCFPFPSSPFQQGLLQKTVEPVILRTRSVVVLKILFLLQFFSLLLFPPVLP